MSEDKKSSKLDIDAKVAERMGDDAGLVIIKKNPKK